MHFICSAPLSTLAGAAAGVSDYVSCNAYYSTVAAGEWFILFIFDLYILSIVLDLWPSIR